MDTCSGFCTFGTIQVEAGIESRERFEMYTGAFYYKNRLFVVSIGANTGLSSYPFLQLTGCKLRVVGSDLGGDGYVYASELEFASTESGYEIIENDLCSDVKILV